jgi:hypothetical protein
MTKAIITIPTSHRDISVLPLTLAKRPSPRMQCSVQPRERSAGPLCPPNPDEPHRHFPRLIFQLRPEMPQRPNPSRTAVSTTPRQRENRRGSSAEPFARQTCFHLPGRRNEGV